MATRGVRERAAAAPDAPAIVDGHRRMTYAELVDAAGRLSRVYADLGVTRDAPVAVMLPNSTELLVAGIAAAFAGAPQVPVNWHLKAEELGWILADSGVRVLVADATLARYVAAAVAAAPGCTVLFVGEPDADAAVPAALDYVAAVAAAPGGTPTGGWRTPQWVFYTSGTTGRPKGVVHERADAAAMERAQDGLVALWDFTPDDVYALAGPAYHAGPGGYAFTTLYAGGTVVVMREWQAAEFLRLVDTHRVTTTFLTPAHFIRLLELPEDTRAAYDGSSLRLVIHGGAPCPVEVKRAALDLLSPADVVELYGASEGGATKITAAQWRERPGSVGLPWPGVEIRILDEQGAPLPAGADGLVYVRPAGGARFHYHRDDDKTTGAWRDDAFTVGDVGHLDEDGYLYLTDRAGDMVLWGGVNVYPREIEEALHAHPAVVDCAVVGVPDPRYGEVLAAIVELRSDVDAEELRAHCRSRLADFKCPARIERVEQVPRDPNGKVRKPDLRRWFAARDGGPDMTRASV